MLNPVTPALINFDSSPTKPTAPQAQAEGEYPEADDEEEIVPEVELPRGEASVPVEAELDGEVITFDEGNQGEMDDALVEEELVEQVIEEEVVEILEEPRAEVTTPTKKEPAPVLGPFTRDLLQATPSLSQRVRFPVSPLSSSN